MEHNLLDLNSEDVSYKVEDGVTKINWAEFQLDQNTRVVFNHLEQSSGYTKYYIRMC